MQKKLFLIISTFLLSLSATAQTIAQTIQAPDDNSWSKPFKHMNIGLTAGSTGVGVDVAANINKNISLRVGVAYMPEIRKYADYSLASVGYDVGDTARIKRLCGYLSDFIGDTAHIYVDDKVNVRKSVCYFNAKVLVDWYPFKKKNWHFTAGFYYGTTNFAKAINSEYEAPTMVAINIYNRMYDDIIKLDEYEYPTISIGGYGFTMDPEMGQMVKDKFKEYGRVAVCMGRFPDGTVNYVTPEPDGVIRAQAETNAFKPYLGCGYSTQLDKEKRWTLDIEAGALFWGKPHVYVTNINNQRVDLIRDVTDINGSVGNDIKLLKHLPVLPNIQLRLAYSIF